MATIDPELAAELAANKQHRLDQVAPAALRIAEYFVRCRPRFVVSLCDEDKIDFEDFQTVSGYFGISTYEYEG